MEQYEYKEFSTRGLRYGTTLAEELTKLGADGWHVVGSTLASDIHKGADGEMAGLTYTYSLLLERRKT